MLIVVTVFYTRNQKSIDAMSTLISKKKKKFLLENYYTFLLLDDIYIDFLTEQSRHFAKRFSNTEVRLRWGQNVCLC